MFIILYFTVTSKENNIIGFLGPILIFLALNYFFLFYNADRFWALNLFSYSEPVTYYIILLLIIILFSFIYLLYRKQLILPQVSWGAFIISSCLTILIYFIFAFLWQAKTYFLGDGYTVLSLLSEGNPLYLKERQIGSAIIHKLIFDWLGGNPYQSAITSYKIVSFASMIIYAFVTAIFSNRIFQDNFKKLLFLIGMLSCGNTLMFFGYVENYSIFNILLLSFMMYGYSPSNNSMKKWLVLLIWLLMVSFHIFGVLFLPAVLFWFISNTKLENIFKKNRTNGMLFGGAGLLIFVLVVSFVYNSDYFIRFSIVPLFSNRFTQEGYLLFSLNHILDFAQLVFILLPGLLFVFFNLKIFMPQLNKRTLFLIISLASALLGAFIFDPKLGMPRDWDLFAFCAVPLGILFYTTLLEHKGLKPIAISLLAIVLGFTMIFARAEIIHSQEKGVNQFYSYLYLDKVKNRNSWQVLYDYYKKDGDTLKADSIYAEWKSLFPEEKLLAKANELYLQEKDINATIKLLRQILEINPTYADAYGFLGNCYLDINRIDSALILIKISDALSPNRPNNLNNLGTVYSKMGDLDLTETYYLKAAKYDTINFIYPYNLYLLYKELGDSLKQNKYLELAASKDNAPIQVKRQYFLNLIENDKFQKAYDYMTHDDELQYDTLFIDEINKRYQKIQIEY